MSTQEQQLRPVMNALRWIQGMTLIVAPGIGVLVGFEIVTWTDQQIGIILGFMGAVVAFISHGLGVRAEAQVTPVENPKDNTGTSLVPANVDPIV